MINHTWYIAIVLLASSVISLADASYSTIKPSKHSPTLIPVTLAKGENKLITILNSGAEIALELHQRANHQSAETLVHKGYDEYQLMQSQLFITHAECSDCIVIVKTNLPLSDDHRVKYRITTIDSSDKDRLEAEKIISENFRQTTSRKPTADELNWAADVISNSSLPEDQLRPYLYKNNANKTNADIIESYRSMEIRATDLGLLEIATSRKITIVRDQLWRAGKSEEALTALTQIERDIKSSFNNQSNLIAKTYLVGRVQLTKGRIESQRGNYNIAKDHLLTAKEHFESIGHAYYTAESLSEIGISLRFQNLFSESVPYLREAYKVGSSGILVSDSQLLRIRYQMAAVSILTNRYYLAERLLEEVDLENLPLYGFWKGHFLALKARIALELDQLEEAESIYLQAWEIYDIHNQDSHKATLAKNLIRLYGKKGDEEKAEYYLNFAHKNVSESWGTEQELSVNLAKIDILLSNKQPEIAIDEINSHYEAAKRLTDDKITRQFINRRAEALLQKYDNQAAASELEHAIALNREEKKDIVQAKTHFLLAKAEFRQSNLHRALQHINSAMNIVENIRSNQLYDDLRRNFFGLHKNIYELKINIILAQKSQDSALESLQVAESFKARTFFESIKSSNGRDDIISEWQWLDSEQVLRSSFDTAQQSVPLHTAWASPSKKLVSDHQKNLGNDDGILFYFLGSDSGHAWLIKKDEIKHRKLPDVNSLKKVITNFRRSVSSSPTHKNPRTLWNELSIFGSEAYQQLIGDFGTILGPITTLTVIPDGELHQLPFSAMLDEQGIPIATKTVIRHAASLSIDEWLIRQDSNTNTKTNNRLLLVANPKIDNDQPLTDAGIYSMDLHHSILEARELQSAWDTVGQSTVLTGREATKDAVLEQLNEGYDIIHFATHAVVDWKEPDRSAIKLATDDNNDILYNKDLTLADISQLSLNTELVVLSACETGSGFIDSGEGPIALSRSLFEAGVKRVVASIWPVDDTATQKLVTHFYEALIELNLPPADALNHAKLAMLKSSEFSHPYYWSGFIAIGKQSAWDI